VEESGILLSPDESGGIFCAQAIIQNLFALALNRRQPPAKPRGASRRRL